MSVLVYDDFYGVTLNCRLRHFSRQFLNGERIRFGIACSQYTKMRQTHKIEKRTKWHKKNETKKKLFTTDDLMYAWSIGQTEMFRARREYVFFLRKKATKAKKYI